MFAKLLGLHTGADFRLRDAMEVVSFLIFDF
jgi:hypothetical protein